MDKKLRQQYNLPDFLTGKTPAEDHKLLMKRFKDRKDPVSQRTMQAITEKLAQVQEDVKAQQNQGMMDQQAPMPEQGMPQEQAPQQMPQEQMPQQGAPDMGQMFAMGGGIGPGDKAALAEYHKSVPLFDPNYPESSQVSRKEELLARELERGEIDFDAAKQRYNNLNSANSYSKKPVRSSSENTRMGAPNSMYAYSYGGRMNKYAHGGLHTTPTNPGSPGTNVDTVRDFDKFKDLPLQEFHRNMPLTDPSFTQQPSAREEFTARALERGDISFEDAKSKLFPNQMGHGGKVNRYDLGAIMATDPTAVQTMSGGAKLGTAELMPTPGATAPGAPAPAKPAPTGPGAGVKKLQQTMQGAPMRIATGLNNMNEQKVAGFGKPTQFYKPNKNNSFAAGGIVAAADLAAGLKADSIDKGITGAMDLTNTIGTFGEGQKVDTTGGMSYDTSEFKKQNNGMAVAGQLGGAGMKAATGDIYGAAADFGKLASDHLFGGNKKTMEKMKEANFQHGQGQALQKTGISSFAYGGKINKYAHGGKHDPPTDRLGEIIAGIDTSSTPSTPNNPRPPVDRFKQAANAFRLNAIPDSSKQLRTNSTLPGTSNTTTGKPLPGGRGQFATDAPAELNVPDIFYGGIGAPTAFGNIIPNTTTSTPTGSSNDETEKSTTTNKKDSKAGKFLKNNAADLLSLGAKTLPLLKKHSKPQTAGATRVQKEYTPQQFDEKRFINEQRASDNSKEQIRNLSGGNPAAARAMAMSANRNKLFATSKGMQAADDLNRTEKAKQFESQSRNEQINARMSEIYKDRKAKDDAAYSKAEYDRKSQIGANVSDFAKELSDKQTVVNMTGYRGNATYVKQDGTKVEAMEKDGKFYGKDGEELTGGTGTSTKNKNKKSNGSNK